MTERGLPGLKPWGVAAFREKMACRQGFGQLEDDSGGTAKFRASRRSMARANKSLKSLLLPAYAPCEGFRGGCARMVWNPKSGHVPRGFCGATGPIRDVRLILVCAEPGDPYPGEGHSPRSADKIFESTYADTLKAMQRGRDLFHRNIRLILDLCFPRLSFNEQMRLTWITDSVLCSASVECGAVPASSIRECGARFLKAQLEAMPQATVAALGSKAAHRLSRLGREFIAASAAAPSGCNRPSAYESWQLIAKTVRGRSRRQ